MERVKIDYMEKSEKWPSGNNLIWCQYQENFNLLLASNEVGTGPLGGCLENSGIEARDL